MRKLTLITAALVACTCSVALAAGGSYKGTVDGDRSQKLTFKVRKGAVRNWTATIYASCFTGNQLTTVVVRRAKLGANGGFKARYRPVPGNPTVVTLRGRVRGARASGTVKQTGSCSFERQPWKAKRQ